jgi:hypothetical protein
MSKAQPIPAPEHLSQRSKELWTALVPRRAKSPERLALLVTALEALDRADAARSSIEVHGMVTVTEATKAVHVHPLVRVERESRQLFAKIWKTLELTWSIQLDGRS